MRTTLAFDGDVLTMAKHLAERDGKTVGEVVSALARQGLASDVGATRRARNGVPLLPSRQGAAPATP